MYIFMYIFIYAFIYLFEWSIHLSTIYIFIYLYPHIYHYLFISLFNCIDLLVGEKIKIVTFKFLILFYFLFFLAPTFTFICYLLQPRMHSVKYSARGVHAAHQKKKNLQWIIPAF